MKEALKLALESLERSVATCFDQYAHQQVRSQPDHFINQAITALRLAIDVQNMASESTYKAALAQPAQEPVGKWLGKEVEWTENPYKFKQGQPLYTTPPQRKPLPPELEDNSGYNSIQCAAYRAGWENAEVAHGIKETTE